MPLDVRKLIFSQQELHLAFQTYAKDNKMNVPKTQIEMIHFIDPENDMTAPDTMSGFTAVVNFTSTDPNNPHRLHLDKKQVLEALVNMCRGLKIPLPRKGQKFLQIHKDGLAMTIGLGEQDIREYMAISAAAAGQPAQSSGAAKVARPD